MLVLRSSWITENCKHRNKRTTEKISSINLILDTWHSGVAVSLHSKFRINIIEFHSRIKISTFLIIPILFCFCLFFSQIDVNNDLKIDVWKLFINPPQSYFAASFLLVHIVNLGYLVAKKIKVGLGEVESYIRKFNRADYWNIPIRFTKALKKKSSKIQSSKSKLSSLPTVSTVERVPTMKKKDTDLWLVRNRASGKVKVTTRCIVVPPSPTDVESDRSSCDVTDTNNNNNININSPTLNLQTDFNAQQDIPSPCTESANHNYPRNRSTTRSWPVIYRNNSLSSNTTSNFLEPSTASKTEQLLSKSEQKRKSTHQYDFDQIFGLNNVNYQQYLASVRKQSSGFGEFGGYDKSPSIYDMQHVNHPEQNEQTQTSFCSTPPTVIFLLLTLLMTTTATAMLCAAIMTDHWENIVWDGEALEKSINHSHPSKQIQFFFDKKVAKIQPHGEFLSLKLSLLCECGFWVRKFSKRKCHVSSLLSFSCLLGYHNISAVRLNGT